MEELFRQYPQNAGLLRFLAGGERGEEHETRNVPCIEYSFSIESRRCSLGEGSLARQSLESVRNDDIGQHHTTLLRFLWPHHLSLE